MLTSPTKHGAELQAQNVGGISEFFASDRPFEEPDESRTCHIGAQVEASDEELVLRAQQGDGAAFVQLTDRHLATCLVRANRILRNRAEAEEQVQNTLMKAFENLDQFRFAGPFSAWLCRILRNECLIFIREHRKGKFLAVDACSESKVGLELVDQLANQEDNLVINQAMNLLRKELLLIPPLMRNVIKLRDIEGLDMSEVADRLNRSVPAAKSRLMRARKELRKRLAKYYGPNGPRTLLSRPATKKVEYKYTN
jgi:RNA polymerase sigma-70 factor, ECF subfamily